MPFSELFGNRRAKKVLSSYLRNQMIPSTLMFSGTGSVNLKGFAIAFAQALNCGEMDGDFCGKCDHCRDIARDMFPDVCVLVPDGQQYKKEQVAFLLEDQLRRPMKGDYKVYIVTDAHKLSESSANAFLKVLEEPASASIFILLTPGLANILPTIQSRCQVLKFAPPAPAEIREYLKDKGLDPDQASLLARLSQSQRLDLLAGDQKEFLEMRASVMELLGRLLRRRELGDVLVELNRINRRRDVFIAYFRELVNLISLFLRDIMILKAGGNDELLFNLDYRKELMSLSEYISQPKLLFLIRRMEMMIRDVQRNLNAKVLTQEFIRCFSEPEVPGV